MRNLPKIGVGVLVFNNKNQILLAKRKNAHGDGTYSAPGGHLEYGESPEYCAIREVKEETNLDIINPEFFALTNDIFEEESKHYITILMKAYYNEGDVITNMEPEKSEDWAWFDYNNLPKNLFLPLKNLGLGKVYGRIKEDENYENIS